MWKESLPTLSRAKGLESSFPSNNDDPEIHSTSRRRNSLLGPPKSTPSSSMPVSSENLIDIVQLGSYDTLLKPRRAPSQTEERFILNRHWRLLVILVASSFSSNWAGTSSPLQRHKHNSVRTTSQNYSSICMLHLLLWDPLPEAGRAKNKGKSKHQ